MKINDIVIYNGMPLPHLTVTVGKQYRIFEIDNFLSIIRIIDDNHTFSFYPIRNFISLYEYNVLQRKNKIKNILK